MKAVRNSAAAISLALIDARTVMRAAFSSAGVDPVCSANAAPSHSTPEVVKRTRGSRFFVAKDIAVGHSRHRSPSSRLLKSKSRAVVDNSLLKRQPITLGGAELL